MALAQLNQSVSTLAGLMEAIYDFATTAGAGNPAWTGDVDPGATPGEFAISIGALGTNTDDIQVACGWDTGGPSGLAIYQYDHASGAGNYNTGRAGPWDQDRDSGSGAASTSNASIINDRHVLIGNTPLRYWAFASESDVKYLYVVVESSSGEFRHFGFGELKKFNDWNGGAFAYGWRHAVSSGSSMATQLTNSYLLDGYFSSNSNERFLPTIRADGLPGQVAGGLYCVVAGSQNTTGTDRQSNGGGSDTARGLMQGGLRASPIAQQVGDLKITPATGFAPGYPIPLFYVASSEWYGPMGVMEGVRGINIDQFVPGEQVTIGGSTWVVFPIKRKTGDNTSGGTGNSGVMYRVNT